jgi:uncharacterized protein YbjT (DUF2867 family)
MVTNSPSIASRVLAVGAAGKVARHVIPALAVRGINVRAFVRSEADGGAARLSGAAEVAIGDLTDAASIAAALQGVDAAFYIAPAFMPDEATIGRSFVAAAKKAGVRRIVFSSVIHPVLSALVNHAAKAPVEEAILDSGLEYSFLHPALFFQNYAASWPQIVTSGVLAEPWSCETRFSRVDYRDVAEVVAIALAEDRLLYGTFELCAEGWLDRHAVAALIGEVLGRGIAVVRTDPATLGAEADRMRPMFAHYDHHGLRGNALTLGAILGRPPAHSENSSTNSRHRRRPHEDRPNHPCHRRGRRHR